MTDDPVLTPFACLGRERSKKASMSLATWAIFPYFFRPASISSDQNYLVLIEAHLFHVLLSR